MASVKDVATLYQTCARASNMAQDILSVSAGLINMMQEVTTKLSAEIAYSTTLVADAGAKVARLEAEIAMLVAGLPETAGALASAKAELAVAMENLALMERRLSMASELGTEFSIFCGDTIATLNAKMGQFDVRVDSLNARISHATNALESYFNTNIARGSSESIRQKSQYFEYQKLLYGMDKASMKDVERAYIEKLNAKKDSFITAKNASELGIKISTYNMPEFENSFETTIAVYDFDKERYAHDKIANKALQEALKDKSELKNIFDSRQLQQIEKGITPDGYTWHHDGNPPPGRMQLVDTKLHNTLRHTGGYSLWCERD